eukprot:3679278-Ditylum_brightwellii.AAC.1
MGGTVGAEARSSSRRRGKVAVAFSSAFRRKNDWCWAWSHAVFLIIFCISGLGVVDEDCPDSRIAV